MAIAIVEELWTRIRAAIDDKIVAVEAAAASAEADRVVVEQAATSASWSEDRLTVLGATSPSLTGPQGPKGDKGDKGDPGDGTGDVLWSELTPALDGKAPVSHTHTALQISDATTTGRNVLKASSQSAARSAIGAGTSNLALGTTSSTAAAGNHTHTASDVGAAPASHTHKSDDISDAHHYIGSAVTANRVVKTYSNGHIYVREDPPSPDAVPRRKYVDDQVATKADVSHTHTASQISDATTVGRNVLKASSQAAARSAIGAGTSNLAIGTTSSTAAAGNHTHTLPQISGALTNSQLPAPEIIPVGADLNNYLSTGLYLQNADADARSGLNYPPNATNAGMLEVIAGSNFVYQRYTEYRAGRVFSRVKYGSAWRAWIELLDSNEATHTLGSASYGKVVRREDNSDAIRAGNPTQTYHAANKQYVDGRTPEVRVVSALPASPSAGVIYMVTE